MLEGLEEDDNAMEIPDDEEPNNDIPLKRRKYSSEK
jgi:hypothetical protein